MQFYKALLFTGAIRTPIKAEAIGRSAEHYMETTSMAPVYDYMYHLISGYSELLDFTPVSPSSAL